MSFRPRTLLAAFACVIAVTAAPTPVLAQQGTTMQTTNSKKMATKRTGHVMVNGVNYYYAIQGRGEPLLVLHGGLGSSDMFGPVLPMLAKTHQVIAVDLHGHGRTALGDRKIDLPDMGNDMAGVLEKLGYKQADVFGYSLGGGVALQFAFQHPLRVKRLVVASAGFAQDGFYPEMLPMQSQVGAAMADAMKPTPMYQSYVKVAPHPDEFPKLLDQMGEWMRKSYDWSEDVKKLAMPVMLVYGDSDMFRPEHIVRFYQLLGGGLKDAGWQREHMARNRLAILPNLTHYEMFAAPEMGRTVLAYLDGKDGPASWSDQVKKGR